MLFARSIAIVVFLVFGAPASAATVNVTSLADSGPGTLRAAIAAAPQGDATTIVLPAGTITLASKLTIANRSLTITGQGAPATAISGGGVTRLIDVTDDSPLSLSTLTLRDGADDTVSVLNAPGGAKLTLDRVDLRANTSAQGADGNGTIALKGGSLSMNSGQVVGNVAGGTGHKVTGGIVKAQDADVDVSGVLFDANSAGGGGGAGAAVGALFALTDGAAPNSTLNMTQVAATGNHGGGGGGTAAGDGLVDASGYDVAATLSTFTGNVLGGGDGTAAGFGIFTATAGASRSATVSLDGVTVSGNAIGVGPAGGTGGAVSVSSSADSAVLGVSVTRSLISDNDVGGQGGVGFGGAINAAATGASDKLAVTVAQSTIAGNRVGVGTGGVGGAVAISGSGSGTTSALHTTVSTISGNTAGSSAAHDGYGGGLETGPSSSLDVAETTIAGNRVTGPKGHGGGIYAAGGTIARSIVAANTAADHGNCLASLTSGGHNLESANSCGFNGAGDLTGTDPGLAPLGNFGGLLEVQALLPGSRAANAAGGCRLEIDERGIPRPQGPACDIGAVEAALPSPTTLQPTNLAASSATLTGTLGRLGDPVITTFETGATPAYGTSVPGLVTAIPEPPAPIMLTPRLSVTGPIKNLVRHTIYHARLDAMTAAGTVNGNDVAFTVPAPIATVRNFRVTPSTFRPLAAARSASRKRPRVPAGTRFQFRASDIGAAAVLITHGASGRRSGKSCVKPTRKLRRHAPCTRTITDGSVRFRVAKAGLVEFPFSGRIGKHVLGAASYKAKLTLLADQAPAASKPATATFSVRR